MPFLIDKVISLAHRLIYRQGENSPAYPYLSRSINAACESAYAPRRARFEAQRFGVTLHAKGITISGEVCLESLRFKVSQRHNLIY